MKKSLIILIGFVLNGCGSNTPATNSYGIQSGFSCIKFDAGIGLQFLYKSDLFTNGDRYVECEVQTSSAQYSSSSYYKSTQPGAANGSCFVGYDLDAASSGFWTYTFSGSTYQTVYSDAGSPSNGHLDTFTGCTTF